jgi:hypothetical protein
MKVKALVASSPNRLTGVKNEIEYGREVSMPSSSVWERQCGALHVARRGAKVAASTHIPPHAFCFRTRSRMIARRTRNALRDLSPRLYGGTSLPATPVNR